MLLIGSIAARYRGTDLSRTPKDVDVIATYDEANRFLGILRARGLVDYVHPAGQGRKLVAEILGAVWEFELAWEGTTARALVELVETDPVSAKRVIWDQEFTVPSKDVLYALKLSHRFLKDSPHFLKTMRDIQRFRHGCCYVPSRYDDWLKAREKETYSYGHPKLNQGKAGFFSGDGVTYVYDHDSIHEAVKHLDAPVYTMFKKDGAEVACDRAKFDGLRYSTRLYSVLEEAYVLALERSQIPFKGQIDPQKSFDIALMKVCTSITSGWWREFAWENYGPVRALYDPSYVDRFWTAVERGIVKPYAPKG